MLHLSKCFAQTAFDTISFNSKLDAFFETIKPNRALGFPVTVANIKNLGWPLLTSAFSITCLKSDGVNNLADFGKR